MNEPIQRAFERWQAINKRAEFTHWLDWYLANGYVYSGPDCFIMALPWKRGAEIHVEHHRPDCWFVMLAGSNGYTDIKRFMELAPFKLPYAAFHRRGKMRIYEWSKLKRKLIYGHNRSSTTA